MRFVVAENDKIDRTKQRVKLPTTLLRSFMKATKANTKRLRRNFEHALQQVQLVDLTRSAEEHLQSARMCIQNIRDA